MGAGPAVVPFSQHAVAVPEAAPAAPQEAAAAEAAAAAAAAAATAITPEAAVAAAAPVGVAAAPEAAATAVTAAMQAQAAPALASASAGSAAEAAAGQQAKEEDPSAVSLRLVHSAAKLGLKVRQLSLQGNRRMLAGAADPGGSTDRKCCMFMRGGNTLTRLHLCVFS